MAMSAPELAYLIVALILLAALACKARGPGGPARGAVRICLAALLAATLAQLCTGVIDRGSGVAHLAEAVSDWSAMVAACAGMLFFSHVNSPASMARARARRLYGQLAVALTLAVALFALCPAGHLSRAQAAAGVQPPYVYLYVYVCYIGAALLSVCRMAASYSRLAGRGALRLGLRLLAVGCGCGLCFLAVQAVMLVGTEAGAVFAGRLTGSLAEPLELATETVLLAGITAPAWGRWLGAAARWARAERSCRRLFPLWSALCHANPGLSLLPPTPGGWRWRRDPGFLLYRQVVEIRDAQLALRPYVPPEALPLAESLARERGGSPQQVRAVSEAAAIAAALRAKARGQRGAPVPASLGCAGGTDLAAEVAWLAGVARAFARSPVIPATLAALPAPEPARTG
jgi:hypothetical protein